MPDAPARRFRPGAAATVATVVALAVLLALGIWQLRRMEWKRELIAAAEASLAGPPTVLGALPPDLRSLDWRRVRVRLELLDDRSFALGTEARAGELGARLVTPARLPDGSLVLLDRGFVAEADLPPHLPGSMRANGPVVVEGVARSLTDRRAAWFTPEDEPEARRFWRLDPRVLEDFVGEPVAPVLIVAERAEPAAILGRTAPVRVEVRDPHLGYALTWFGLAAALAVIYLLFGFTRGRPRPEER